MVCYDIWGNPKLQEDIYTKIEFPERGYALYSFYKKKGNKEVSISSSRVYQIVKDNLGEFEDGIIQPLENMMPIPVPGSKWVPSPVPRFVNK